MGGGGGEEGFWSFFKFLWGPFIQKWGAFITFWGWKYPLPCQTM